MQGLQLHLRLSQGGCHVLEWTDCQMEVLRSNSPCSLESWINFSSTRHISGGMRFPLSGILGQVWSNVDDYSRGFKEIDS
jgi:hypothetical protein